jgi:hypothetical protein
MPLNTGIRATREKFFHFLDDGDSMEKCKLELQAEFLRGHPAVGIVCGDAYSFMAENPDSRLNSRKDDN